MPYPAFVIKMNDNFLFHSKVTEKYLKIHISFEINTAWPTGQGTHPCGSGVGECAVPAGLDSSLLLRCAFHLPHAALLLGKSGACSLGKSIRTRMRMVQRCLSMSLPLLSFTSCP